MIDKLTSSKRKLLFYSLEKMCNVIKQKILKGQELNALETICDVNKYYIDSVIKYPEIKDNLSKLLENQYNSLLTTSKKRGYLLITEEIEKGIEIYKI